MTLGEGFLFEKSWQQKLECAITHHTDGSVSDQVMKGGTRFGEKSNPKKIIGWTVKAVKILERETDEETFRDILAGCTCRHPEEELEQFRRLYRETGDIGLVHDRLQRYFLSFIREYKELEDEHIDYITSHGMGIAGRIEGDTIIAVKIPKDFKAYLASDDAVERRYLYCHCPRLREAVRSGIPVPRSYCYCGAGYYRALWEYILGRRVRVEVTESVLSGDERCAFTVSVGDSEAEAGNS